jgi:nitrogenase molybdenum-iron protein alpha/beta subunit
MPKPPTINEMQQARYGLEKKALAEIARDKMAIVRRKYEEARQIAVQHMSTGGDSGKYHTGRADAWEEILQTLTKAQKGDNN